MQSHFKKKEGWWGVAVTALVCGGFLWWWFQPVPIDARTERDPLHWLALARKELGSGNPPASACFECLVIALSFQQAGKDSVAGAIATDWLPPAWRDALAAVPGPGVPGDSVLAPDLALVPLFGKLTQAQQSLDQLEIEQGQKLFREAAEMADDFSRLHPAAGDRALWLVAARQARSGFGEDAAQTRQRVRPGDGPPLLPEWLIMEFPGSDMAAPALAWIDAHPTQAADVLNKLVTVLKNRLLHHEAGELASHGPRADPTSIHSPSDLALFEIHQAAEAGQLETAGESARRFPSGPPRATAYLAIARTLAWR
jgi:hypothetical protein